MNKKTENNESGQTKKSKAWFHEVINKSKRIVSKVQKLEDLIGSLVFINYSPKTKEILPFYDQYPLLFVINTRGDNFLGLNVHYLNVPNRKILVERLYEYAKRTKSNQVKLNFQYEDVENFTEEHKARFCLKMYYYKNIKNFMVIDSSEWNKIIYLPLQKFEKKSASYVWRQL